MERVEASSNFANKLWNASRFVMMNLEQDKQAEYYANIENSSLELPDKWILARLNDLIKEVSQSLEKYELGIVAQKLYDFIWGEYCDWYIELVKHRLYGEEQETKASAQKVLCFVLDRLLKLLHPFMPFITEEIWQYLPHEGKTIMLAQWPEHDSTLINDDAQIKMQLIMDVIRSIRNMRAEMNVAPSKKAKVILVIQDTDISGIFDNNRIYLEKLASASEVIIYSSSDNIPENAVTSVVENVQVFIPLGELVDYDKEIERLEKEKERITGEIERVNRNLANKGFVDKAPEKVVRAEVEKKEKYEHMLEKVLESIANLKNR